MLTITANVKMHLMVLRIMYTSLYLGCVGLSVPMSAVALVCRPKLCPLQEGFNAQDLHSNDLNGISWEL